VKNQKGAEQLLPPGWFSHSLFLPFIHHFSNRHAFGVSILSWVLALNHQPVGKYA
jgi:hypothetical protein